MSFEDFVSSPSSPHGPKVYIIAFGFAAKDSASFLVSNHQIMEDEFV
jgi:hypothetical protein